MFYLLNTIDEWIHDPSSVRRLIEPLDITLSNEVDTPIALYNLPSKTYLNLWSAHIWLHNKTSKSSN